MCTIIYIIIYDRWICVQNKCPGFASRRTAFLDHIIIVYIYICDGWRARLYARPGNGAV